MKKNRQHNDQKKKYKRTNNDLQNIHINQLHYAGRQSVDKAPTSSNET